MSGDAFTKARFTWLDAVKADRTLTAPAFKAAYELATQWTNGEKFEATGDLLAWPALMTIAAGISMGERSTRQAVKQLVDEGWLVIDGHVAGRQPLYKLVVKRQGPAASNRQEAAALNRQGSAALESVEAAESRRAPRQSPAALKRQSSADKPFDKPSEEPFDRDISPPRLPLDRHEDEPIDGEVLTDDGFDDFWRAYPKRVAKEAARKAWAKALKRGDITAAEIITVAARYAAERRGDNPKYTAHPASWLTAGRWADEPASTDNQPIPTQRGGGGSWIDGLAEYSEGRDR